MNQSFKLTVNDVMKNAHFEHAKVIAGENGLDKIIRWIHIIEVTEISHLLNGNELILTTGLGWQENKELSLSLIKQMIEKHVSGLCIELGTYIQDIPQLVIDLANSHDFPVIVFSKEVRFIDITQDLNGLFVESHNQMMVKLESISNQFNRLLLLKDGFQKILRLLHKSLNVQVAYIPKSGKYRYYPMVSRSSEQEVIKKIEEAKPQSVVNTEVRNALKPIEAMGVKFADLVIISNEQDLDELDYLVLDRAATALSQDQLRLLYIEEKQRHEKNQWVHDWIKGAHEQSDILEYLLEQDPNLEINDCTICIYEPNRIDFEKDITYSSLLFSSIFKRHGFFPLVSYERNYLIFVLINNRSINSWKERLKKAVVSIEKEDVDSKSDEGKVNIGVGKLNLIDKLYKSYEQAQQTIYANKKGLSTALFYEELYINRLIIELNKHKVLDEYVYDYLKPLLIEENKEMLDTLKVLLEVNGSRKEAADKLFIVRQTLYHRIDKLKELLGNDFMEGEKRLALEFAIHAKEFLN